MSIEGTAPMRDINAMSRTIDRGDSVDASALDMSPPVMDTACIDGKPVAYLIMSHQPRLPENRSEADQWQGKAVNGMFSFYSNMAQGIAPIAAAGICSFTRGYQTVVWAVFLISIRSAIAFFRGYSL
ncbi:MULTISPECIES: hypothetical protein [unclassified Paraburkholderia]|uniref:hypothetical protein n=1 Tax=unclassified Paraburkholderia TaxID=2615204 RepID=UPI0015E67251|nr:MULTISPECIES: hypothetical protein [unclassified Paraburkholderia]